MEELDAATKIKRDKALGAITAAMAVIIQIYDLSMSAMIIEEARETYGADFVDQLMNDLIVSGHAKDLTTLSEDILKQRAMLNMISPLPSTWMKTRN